MILIIFEIVAVIFHLVIIKKNKDKYVGGSKNVVCMLVSILIIFCVFFAILIDSYHNLMIGDMLAYMLMIGQLLFYLILIFQSMRMVKICKNQYKKQKALSKVVYCSNCGRPAKVSSEYCPECGKKLEREKNIEYGC